MSRVTKGISVFGNYCSALGNHPTSSTWIGPGARTTTAEGSSIPNESNGNTVGRRR